MTTGSGSAAILPAATLDEDAWEDLLSFIEERRVIPIVGPELLRVTTERGPKLLLDWAAEKLASRLSIDRADLPEPYTLNDVVCLFLARRGRREEAYVRLRSVLFHELEHNHLLVIGSNFSNWPAREMPDHAELLRGKGR